MRGLYIGIDVGGTNLKAGAVDAAGRLLAVERRPLAFRDPEAFAADLADLAEAAFSAAGAGPEDALGVGIGLPSLVQETQFDGTSLFYGVLLGVFQLGLAYVCLTTGIRYVKPITASLVTGIEPVLNPILVALAVGEVLTPLALLGGAIVFISVMVYNVLNLRLEKQRAAVPTQEPDLPSRKE